ncbi:MAG: aldo/keto reductase, partial [Muribaculaceae bacterium]|nr:aldo/keto reductase [Muribaculaceae bacterium]
RIIPAVDQIETHVFRQQVSMQKKLEEYGTVLQSWSPLACARGNIFENSVLASIAEIHDKTIAQVALRWLIQRGIPVIPKSTRKERMEENIDILNFELSDDEMEKINQLDKGKSLFNWW